MKSNHDFCRELYKLARQESNAPKFDGRVDSSRSYGGKLCEVNFMCGRVWRDWACCAWDAKTKAMAWYDEGAAPHEFDGYKDKDLLSVYEGYLGYIERNGDGVVGCVGTVEAVRIAKQNVRGGKKRLCVLECELARRVAHIPGCAFRPKKRVRILEVKQPITHTHGDKRVREIGWVRFETDGAKGTWWPEERVVLYSTATMNY